MNLRDEVQSIRDDVRDKQYSFYEMIAGEVEARNASKRMDMTAEERSQSLATETENVP